MDGRMFFADERGFCLFFFTQHSDTHTMLRYQHLVGDSDDGVRGESCEYDGVRQSLGAMEVGM